jgi:hypothetical protein
MRLGSKPIRVATLVVTLAFFAHELKFTAFAAGDGEDLGIAPHTIDVRSSVASPALLARNTAPAALPARAPAPRPQGPAQTKKGLLKWVLIVGGASATALIVTAQQNKSGGEQLPVVTFGAPTVGSPQ